MLLVPKKRHVTATAGVTRLIAAVSRTVTVKDADCIRGRLGGWRTPAPELYYALK